MGGGGGTTRGGSSFTYVSIALLLGGAKGHPWVRGGARVGLVATFIAGSYIPCQAAVLTRRTSRSALVEYVARCEETHSHVSGRIGGGGR